AQCWMLPELYPNRVTCQLQFEVETVPRASPSLETSWRAMRRLIQITGDSGRSRRDFSHASFSASARVPSCRTIPRRRSSAAGAQRPQQRICMLEPAARIAIAQRFGLDRQLLVEETHGAGLRDQDGGQHAHGFPDEALTGANPVGDQDLDRKRREQNNSDSE